MACTCPDHTEEWKLFELLQAETHTGVSLTKNLAMLPAISVSGLYFHHPDSRYFAVGRVQEVDSPAPKELKLADTERWLGPVLDYDRE